MVVHPHVMAGLRRAGRALAPSVGAFRPCERTPPCQRETTRNRMAVRPWSRRLAVAAAQLGDQAADGAWVRRGFEWHQRSLPDYRSSGTPLWAGVAPHISQPSSSGSPVSRQNRLPAAVGAYTRPRATAGWSSTGSPTRTLHSVSPDAADRHSTRPSSVPRNSFPLTRAGGVRMLSSSSASASPSRSLLFQKTSLDSGSAQWTVSPIPLKSRPLATNGLEPWKAQTPKTWPVPRLPMAWLILASPLWPPKPTPPS